MKHDEQAGHKFPSALANPSAPLRLEVFCKFDLLNLEPAKFFVRLEQCHDEEGTLGLRMQPDSLFPFTMGHRLGECSREGSLGSGSVSR